MEIWYGECDFCEAYEERIVRSTNDQMGSICGKCIVKATKLLLESKE